MVTPLARRRPTKVARETVTLDHLSRGRLTLGVGLGVAAEGNDREFGWFGDDSDASVRAGRLDESLDILIGLWSGEHFSYDGRYNRVGDSAFLPASFQQPRIPIWVAGFYDGGFLAPEQVSEILTYIGQHRTPSGPYDFAFVAGYPDNKPDPQGKLFDEYVDAGVTWWLMQVNTVDQAHLLAQSGPPVRG
jgi:Luciferase-like monooxygenase